MSDHFDELWADLEEDEHWEELIPTRYQKVVKLSKLDDSLREAHAESWYD